MLFAISESRVSWPKPMPIVEVEWTDSMRHGGWRTADEWAGALGPDSLACRSSGYLYRDDEHSLTLMQSLSINGSMADAIEIPRFAVQSIRVLRQGKARERRSS